MLSPVGNERVTPETRQVVIQAQPRLCVSCGKQDVAHTIQGEYDPAGNPKIEHLVTIELRYLKKPEDCTSFLKAHGWRFRIHQGRPAMERFICRNCMNEHAIMESEFRRKKSHELKSSSNNQTYYSALCEE